MTHEFYFESLIESSKFENHSKDIDKNVAVPSTSKSVPQRELDCNRSLPKADDCYAKISKWLDLHDVDTQTNRLAPQKDREKEVDGLSISDSDGTESDLENESETHSSGQLKSPQSHNRKGDQTMENNSHEATVNRYQAEIGNSTLPKENSNEHDSDLDENDQSLVSLLNRVPGDGDSIAPSESASCVAAPISNPVTNQKCQPQHNFSPPASQSSICSEGFDNDSIVPIAKNKRKITPEEQQKRLPSTSQVRYKPVLQARKPDKRKSESPPASPRKRRQWSYDEDHLLMKGFSKYKNEKMIWSLIKNKFFANSIRTNVNLKDRARTIGLK